MRVGEAVLLLWAGFALSWIAAMAWSRETAARVSFRAQFAYRVVLLIGGLIFFIPAHGDYDSPMRLWFLPYAALWPAVGAVALGFAFSWWARIWLGPLWSGQVTTKTGHRVVDTGPYGIVRHPIYTGILVAVYATLALKGTVPGVAGAAIITLGLWMKARLEEGWLAEQLGTEAYADYRRRVPMLLPFGPKSA